jgi:NADPH2:quinone reductase
VKALRVTSLNGPDGLELAELPEPEPAPGAVLIDVHAAGVSFPDILLTRGKYQVRPELPFTPGIEVAGVVRAASEDPGLKPGDRVAACTLLGGGFAEVALAPAALTFPVPAALSFAEAAALTINYQTAWLALCRRARLAPGETVLVHGAAGGVGTATVQLAKAFGAKVLAVTSTPEKAKLARQAGADDVLDACGDWAAQARAATNDRGVDVVVDPVGGERFDGSLRCLVPEGRLLVIGFADGDIPQIAANRVLLRNVDIVGVNWGGFLSVDSEFPRQCARELERLADAGDIRPLIGRRYPLEDGAQALRDLADRRASGKLVLEVRANSS